MSSPEDFGETRWGFTHEVMEGMAQRQLALELWLAPTSKYFDRMGIRSKEMAKTGICPQNASAFADILVGESDFRRASMHAAEQLGEDPTQGPS